MIFDCLFCTQWLGKTNRKPLFEAVEKMKEGKLPMLFNQLLKACLTVKSLFMHSGCLVYLIYSLFFISYFLTSVIWLSGFRVDAAWIYFSPFNSYFKLNIKYLRSIKVLQYPFYSMHQSWGWRTWRWQFIRGTETIYSFCITPFV